MILQESAIKTNVPWETLLNFREVGYIDAVLQALLQFYDVSDYEIWVYLTFDSLNERIQIKESNQKQIIFIVGDESNRLPPELIRQAFALFKTYLSEIGNEPHVFPLPIGYSRASKHRMVVPILERSQNIFFSGNLHRGRSKLYQYFTRVKLPFPLLYRIRHVLGHQFDTAFPKSFVCFSNGFHNGLSPEEYSEHLYHSKIVLCPPGLSQPETMRHYEAMRAGCIIVSEKLPNTYFYQNSPILFVENWGEARDIIHRLLDNPTEMVDLHEKTIKWWHSHCSEKAAARYIFTKLKSLTV